MSEASKSEEKAPAAEPAKEAAKVSKEEGGDVRNVESFVELATRIAGFGAKYNPAVERFGEANLRAVRTKLEASLASVRASETPYRDLVDKREEGMKALDKLATRVSDTFQPAANDSQDRDVRSVLKKFRGVRVKKSAADAGSDASGKSVSQRSYVNRIAHMRDLVAIAEQSGVYATNEAGLALPAVKAQLDSLSSLGENIMRTAAAFYMACSERNRLLYAKGTGAVDLALDTKKTVRGIFGSNSPEYKSISGITFKKRAI